MPRRGKEKTEEEEISSEEEEESEEKEEESEDSHLEAVFYSAEGLWKGWSAIGELSKAAGVSKKEAEAFLRRQALWQIFLPPPRKIDRPHWMVDEPNAVHQADLLFMPKDVVFGKKFRYVLVVIDVVSRFKDGEALQAKEASEIAQAFKKIYLRTLKYPAVTMVDAGSEFKGDVQKMFELAGTEIRRGEPKNHGAQAFVERANRTLGEKLLVAHEAEQMARGEEKKMKWVSRLPKIFEVLNSQPTRLTGRKPLEAFAEESLPLKEIKYSRPVGFAEKKLPLWVSVRFLLLRQDLEGERRRATDSFWSLGVFGIDKMRVSANQPILYYLSGEGAPKSNFVREELQVVPEGTVPPPKGLLKKAFV